MFRTRLLSGIVLVAIALILIITGGNVLLVSLGVISLIGLFELYRVLKIQKTPLGIIGYLATGLFYLYLFHPYTDQAAVLVVSLVLAIMMVYVFAFPKYHADQVFGTFFGVFYIAVMISYVYQTRMMEHGHYLVWLIFLASWGCDTCAYCVGVLFGKHKMAPILSPKKSIEGAIGGVVGASLLTLIYGLVVRQVSNISMHMVLVMVVICAIGALISMVGDLAASGIKRNYEVKDYGKLIPGHGGIMDRFDSVFFTAPFIYFLANLFL